MKKFFCLHGLPRAGNTLLGSIINQNPKVAVTANSIIADMLGELYSLKNTDIFKNFPDHKSFDNVTKSLFQKLLQRLVSRLHHRQSTLGFTNQSKIFKRSTRRYKNYSLGKRCARDTSVFYQTLKKRIYIICKSI